MCVPRDTIVLHEIIVVYLESVELFKKDRPSQFVKISYFVLFSLLCVRWHSFHTSFWPAPRCDHHLFVHFCSCWSINSSQFHMIVKHANVFSVFIRKSKVEMYDPRVTFEYWYLKKSSMVRNKVVCDKHYYSNRLTLWNIFVLFYSRFRLVYIFNKDPAVKTVNRKGTFV